MPNDALKFQIGISLIPGIGSITAKKLIAYTGSVEAVFSEKKKDLLKIPGIGEMLAEQIVNQKIIDIAEKEVEYVEKFNIQYSFYLDASYPVRLKNCEDAPVILFYKGNPDFNKTKVLSIVGTRNATDYGKEMCNQLITDLKQRGHDVLIVSGLAYGVDICAHRAALKSGLQTIAVLAHGFGTLYPGVHRATAKEICEQGALLSDFIHTEMPERNNFIKRNRIVAGLCDATLVVESGIKGGALITADIASSYNRDILAIPGKSTDNYSKGCNWLIKTNKAALVETVEDLEYSLGWEIKNTQKTTQAQLFVEVSEEEQVLVNILKEHGELPIDIIALHADKPVSKVSALLLNLEFSGLVRSLPGKIYRIIS